MRTELIPIPEAIDGNSRVVIRKMTKEQFIEEKGSGTLRKNTKIGLNNDIQYVAERAAYEFGWAFEVRPARQVTVGEASTECDEKAITELGWFAERYISMCLFPGDEAVVKYITVEAFGEQREGIGIVITKTSALWVGETKNDKIVFAIVTEWDKTNKKWKPAVNPC